MCPSSLSVESQGQSSHSPSSLMWAMCNCTKNLFFSNFLSTPVEYCQWANHTSLLEFIKLCGGGDKKSYLICTYGIYYVVCRHHLNWWSCHASLLTCHHVILKWCSYTFITYVGPLKQICCHVIGSGDRSPHIWMVFKIYAMAPIWLIMVVN